MSRAARIPDCRSEPVTPPYSAQVPPLWLPRPLPLSSHDAHLYLRTPAWLRTFATVPATRRVQCSPWQGISLRELCALGADLVLLALADTSVCTDTVPTDFGTGQGLETGSESAKPKWKTSICLVSKTWPHVIRSKQNSPSGKSSSPSDPS